LTSAPGRSVSLAMRGPVWMCKWSLVTLSHASTRRCGGTSGSRCAGAARCCCSTAAARPRGTTARGFIKGFGTWNLDVREGRLVLWSPCTGSTDGEIVDVEEQLVANDLVTPGGIEVRAIDAPYAAADGEGVGAKDWVEAVLWKRVV